MQEGTGEDGDKGEEQAGEGRGGAELWTERQNVGTGGGWRGRLREDGEVGVGQVDRRVEILREGGSFEVQATRQMPELQAPFPFNIVCDKLTTPDAALASRSNR